MAGIAFLIYTIAWTVICKVLSTLISAANDRHNWNSLLTMTVGHGFLMALMAVAATYELQLNTNFPNLMIAVAFVSFVLPAIADVFEEYMTDTRGEGIVRKGMMNLRIGLVLLWSVVFVLLVRSFPFIQTAQDVLGSPRRFDGWEEAIGIIGLIFLLPAVVRGIFGLIGVCEYILKRGRSF